MRQGIPLHRMLALTGCILACSTLTSAASKAKAVRPSISLVALPAVGFSPAHIVFTAELKGDPSEDLYCPAVEWDWGDDTGTASKYDCDPFEPVKSEIKRRFVTEKTFNLPGEWRVEIRLKQKDRVVAKGFTNVVINPGTGG